MVFYHTFTISRSDWCDSWSRRTSSIKQVISFILTLLLPSSTQVTSTTNQTLHAHVCVRVCALCILVGRVKQLRTDPTSKTRLIKKQGSRK